MKDIGDRMKRNYERRSRHCLTRRTPVIIRLDGRAFHTFTRGYNRPFDDRLEWAMVQAMKALAQEAQGAKLVYRQSDEISILLTDWDTLQTDAWFDYHVDKLCSVSASIVTVAFNNAIRSFELRDGATFDARAFNLPRDEVANYFLWRAKDWYRNSVSMYALAYFSHRELYKKSMADLHEMLHGIGKNWTKDLTSAQRNGIFYAKDPVTLPEDYCQWSRFDDIHPTFATINTLTEWVMP